MISKRWTGMAPTTTESWRQLPVLGGEILALGETPYRTTRKPGGRRSDPKDIPDRHKEGSAAAAGADCEKKDHWGYRELNPVLL